MLASNEPMMEARNVDEQANGEEDEFLDEEMMSIINQTNSLVLNQEEKENNEQTSNFTFPKGVLKQDKPLVDCTEEEQTEINGFFRNTKFIADTSISKIAKHIRLLGYDCISDPSYSTNYIIYKARSENRIIVTGSASLASKIKSENKGAKPKVKDYYDSDEEENEENSNNEETKQIRYLFIDSRKVEFHDSISDIVKSFHLMFHPAKIYTRCLKCNDPVQCIKATTEEEMQELTKIMGGKRIYDLYGQTVTKCPTCKKFFWEGHYFQRCVKFALQYSYSNRKPSNDSNSDK